MSLYHPILTISMHRHITNLNNSSTAHIIWLHSKWPIKLPAQFFPQCKMGNVSLTILIFPITSTELRLLGQASCWPPCELINGHLGDLRPGISLCCLSGVTHCFLHSTELSAVSMVAHDSVITMIDQTPFFNTNLKSKHRNYIYTHSIFIILRNYCHSSAPHIPNFSMLIFCMLKQKPVRKKQHKLHS